jgi:hypothetical protein
MEIMEPMTLSPISGNTSQVDGLRILSLGEPPRATMSLALQKLFLTKCVALRRRWRPTLYLTAHNPGRIYEAS